MENCWLKDSCNGKDCNEPFCIKQFKLNELYNLAMIPQIHRNRLKLRIDSDGSDLAAFQYLSSYEENIKQNVEGGLNLFIYSTQCGNGKTSWAIRMIQAYLNKIWAKSDLVCRALFIDVPTFLLALKDNISNKNEYIEAVKDNITSADLVVWDDIGAKVGSEFELNHLLSLINTRIMSGKANIYTSNMTPETMNLAIGERLTSRVVNYSNIVNLVGADKRKFAIGGNN